MKARALVLWSELASLEAAGLDWVALAADLPASFGAGIADSLREGDRRLRLVARLLLVRALARIGAGEMSQLTFDSGGRPQLAGDLDPSISHTQGLACAAVAIGCRIGVDVERRQAVERSLHTRVLAPGERRSVARAKDPDGAFLAYWTMKEAAAKADGRGLGLDPQELLCRKGGPFRGPTVRVETRGYRIHALPLPADWIGVLAADAPIDLVVEPYSFT